MRPEELADARTRYMTDTAFYHRIQAAAAALHEHYHGTPDGGIDTGDDDARTVALVAVLGADTVTVARCARCPHDAHPTRTCLATFPQAGIVCGCRSDAETAWTEANANARAALAIAVPHVSGVAPAYPRREVTWTGPSEPVTFTLPTGDDPDDIDPEGMDYAAEARRAVRERPRQWCGACQAYGDHSTERH